MPTVTRRTFLESSARWLGSAVMLSAARWVMPQDSDSLRLALVSDTHISQDPANEYRGFKPYDNFQRVASDVLAMNPAAIFIDGDLARLEGLPGDYAQLKTLLQPWIEACPVCFALGNHDHRENFLAVFDTHPGEDPGIKNKHALIVETAPLRLLVLDSLLFTNEVPGLLGKTQRDWLKEYLVQGDDKPTLVFFHHTLGDGDGDLLDVERVMDILTPHRSVKAVIYGHSHVYDYNLREVIHLINLPALGYNFRDVDPVGWIEATLSAAGGVFKLHAAGGNTTRDGQTTTLQWRA